MRSWLLVCGDGKRDRVRAALPYAGAQYVFQWLHLWKSRHRRVWGVYLKPSLWGDRSAALLSLCLTTACGAKDVGEGFPRPVVLEPQEGGVGPGHCRLDSDCLTNNACQPRMCDDNRCVDLESVVCDDNDPCTTDLCDPESGECTFEPVTPDVDGDGYRRPLPGFLPGTPDACGDDCDDLSAAAFPGNREICDGVDNNCNGIVDDGYLFTQTGRPPILVADASRGAEAAGLVHTSDQYVALVTARDEHSQARLIGLGGNVAPSFSSDVVLSNNDTFGGSLAWSGQVLAVAWEDRRDGDYEIYFNRFDGEGHKLNPDLRVSNAPGFSLDPALIFTGTEYLVGWTDGRNGRGDFRVFGQRVSLLGQLIGGSVNLTPEYIDTKGASLAPGVTEVGLTFLATAGTGNQFIFRAMTYDLAVLGPAVVLSGDNANGGGAVYALGRYVATWSEYYQGTGPGGSIWGAVVDRNGEVLQSPRPLTPGGGFARSHSMLAFGDRLLLAWANDWGQSYDIYMQLFSLELEPLSEPVQVTDSPLDELGPRLRFGAAGEVALLYSERTEDRGPRVLMETLSCN